MTEPTPVVSLEYSDRSQEPWLPMIRFMAIAAAIYAAITIFLYLFIVARIAKQQFSASPMAAQAAFGWTLQLLIELPSEIAAAVILIGGILAAWHHPRGRKTLLVGVAAYVICSGFYSALLSWHELDSMPAQVRPVIFLYSFPLNIFSQAQRYFVLVLFWLFFRKTAVRETMDRA